MDVGAPEGVDGLLGVRDQYEGRLVSRQSEELGEDRPLHRVGVLELVDEGDLEAPPQGLGCPFALEGVAQLSQKVVERNRAGGAPAALYPLDRQLDEAAQASGGGRDLGHRGVGDDPYPRVPQHLGGNGL